MREKTQYQISNRWKNGTVQNMLLKCEYLHDMDTILLGTDDGDGKNHENETDGGNYLFAQMSSIFMVIFLCFVLN